MPVSHREASTEGTNQKSIRPYTSAWALNERHILDKALKHHRWEDNAAARRSRKAERRYNFVTQSFNNHYWVLGNLRGISARR
jgi:hypothetical protein